MRERQLEIIQAAGDILTESGLAGLTTKNLALKMGFAESALYRHFKDKEEIIITMLHYLANEMDDRLSVCCANYDDPGQKLRVLFNDQFTFFENNPHFLVAVFAEGLLEQSKKVNEAIFKLMAIKKKHLLHIIREGQLNGNFESSVNGDDLVQILMGSFRLQMLQWRITNFSLNIVSKGNLFMESVFQLIKKQPTSNESSVRFA